MIIQCPQCQSTYEIANAAAVAGRKVRCTRCYHIWRAEVIEAAAAVPASVEAAPAAVPVAGTGDLAAASAASAATSMSGGEESSMAAAGSGVQDGAADEQHGGGDQSGYGDSSSHDHDYQHGESADDGHPGLAAAAGDDQFAADAAHHDDELLGSDDAPVHDDEHHGDTEPQLGSTSDFTEVSYGASNGSANGLHPQRNGKVHGFSHGDQAAVGDAAASIAAAAPLGERLVRARRGAAADQEFWSDNEPPRREPQLAPARGPLGDRANAARPSRPDDSRVAVAAAESDDVAVPRRRSWAARIGLGFGWLVLIGAVGAIVAAMSLAPQRVIEAVPATANIYDRFGLGTAAAPGLEFAAVSQSWTVDAKARPALEIKGEVRNSSNDPLTVPTVVFALFDQDGLEIFNWATPIKSTKLASGKTTRFTVKIPAPPDAAKKLEVRFAKASE